MKKKVYYKKEEFSFLLNEKRKAVCLLFRPEKRGVICFPARKEASRNLAPLSPARYTDSRSRDQFRRPGMVDFHPLDVLLLASISSACRVRSPLRWPPKSSQVGLVSDSPAFR